jgi:hypothetical protein
MYHSLWIHDRSAAAWTGADCVQERKGGRLKKRYNGSAQKKAPNDQTHRNFPLVLNILADRVYAAGI